MQAHSIDETAACRRPFRRWHRGRGHSYAGAANALHVASLPSHSGWPLHLWRRDLRAGHYVGMPRIRSPAQHRLRIGHCSVPGQVYLLTTVTHQRRPVFADTQLARLAARCIGNVGLWAPSRCLCWVLMPDHWHGLVELGDGAGLASVMQRFKGVLSRRMGQHIDLAGPLWMHGYHDHALRREEDLRAAADYVISNPVRAGLVVCPGDWPHWDAWFVGRGSGCPL